jgi:hypothetical protein
MFITIFNLVACVLNILASVVNYSNGNYGWAVVNGVCSGATFTNIVWLIKEMIEE